MALLHRLERTPRTGDAPYFDQVLGEPLVSEHMEQF